MEELKSKEEKLEEEVKREKERNREMEERYKRYLEKAKVVIKQLDPRFKNSAEATSGEKGPRVVAEGDAAAMTKQLAEKEAQIGRLQKENAQIKQIREKEDFHVASAWYNISAQLAKRSADERLASFINGPSASSSHPSAAASASSAAAASSSSQGQSFLARQRQAHIRKLTLPTGSGAS